MLISLHGSYSKLDHALTNASHSATITCYNLTVRTNPSWLCNDQGTGSSVVLVCARCQNEDQEDIKQRDGALPVPLIILTVFSKPFTLYSSPGPEPKSLFHTPLSLYQAEPATMKLTPSNLAYILYCASIVTAAPTIKRQSGTTYDGGLTANDVENGGMLTHRASNPVELTKRSMCSLNLDICSRVDRAEEYGILCRASVGKGAHISAWKRRCCHPRSQL